jgi:hypothetical protein
VAVLVKSLTDDSQHWFVLDVRTPENPIQVAYLNYGGYAAFSNGKIAISNGGYVRVMEVAKGSAVVGCDLVRPNTECDPRGASHDPALRIISAKAVTTDVGPQDAWKDNPKFVVSIPRSGACNYYGDDGLGARFYDLIAEAPAGYTLSGACVQLTIGGVSRQAILSHFLTGEMMEMTYEKVIIINGEVAGTLNGTRSLTPVMVTPISSDQPGLSRWSVRVLVTMHDGITSGWSLNSVPPPVSEVNYRFTLFGMDLEKRLVDSDARMGDTPVWPLWRMPDGLVPSGPFLGIILGGIHLLETIGMIETE